MTTQQQLIFINGEWTQAEHGKTFEVLNPTNGQVIANVADACVSDTKKALQAASDAQPAWAALPHTERVNYLHKIAEIVKTMNDEFTEALVNEVGSWFGKALFECNAVLEEFRTAAAMTYQSTGEILPSANGKTSMLMRKPVGVVSVISPWNFPTLLSARGFAPAMALGNTVVLKPSEESPISGGILFAKACEQAGLPPGVFNLITCSRDNVADVGEELVANPIVKCISFTGSTAVGKQIGARAGGLLKKTCLELGGKDAIIVLEDADIGLAVNAATFGSFMHQGQICMSTERVIVHKNVAKEFTERFVKNVEKLNVGDPWEINKAIGPIVNKKQLEQIIDQVEDAKTQGADVLIGGTHEGPFYHPTVISNVTNDMKIIQNENFGPVAPIIIAKDTEEAIAIHNSSEYGLSSAIITADVARGLEVAAKLEVGMTHINDSTVDDEPHVPFSGVKNSGLGGHGGKASLNAFTETQWVTVTKEPHYPPFFEES
ncbi:aldehyde dehydrogenase family protein [Thalassotalea castellviae]|uniref:Aldehyde dehydrogenase family protein n=1 Tax=Thalassotalea castellviae TaxID=3075612 RepID=A0ABU3A4G4_9GAMM|nr:aldehyde dehydrogenase family protein [Thalassotalea sp. W431]MDT0603886.1 aldehyde dehydrogenase family protein [Thalassotalea sp. W431]